MSYVKCFANHGVIYGSCPRKITLSWLLQLTPSASQPELHRSTFTSPPLVPSSWHQKCTLKGTLTSRKMMLAAVSAGWNVHKGWGEHRIYEGFLHFGFPATLKGKPQKSTFSQLETVSFFWVRKVLMNCCCYFGKKMLKFFQRENL